MLIICPQNQLLPFLKAKFLTNVGKMQYGTALIMIQIDSNFPELTVPNE